MVLAKRKSLKRNWTKILRIKSTRTEIKNPYDELIIRLDTTEWSKNELEWRSTKTSQNENIKKQKKGEKRPENSRTVEHLQNV